MNNDVLASLEMMLTFGQMMLCLMAQMKKSKPMCLDFLAGAQGFRTLTKTARGFGVGVKIDQIPHLKSKKTTQGGLF